MKPSQKIELDANAIARRYGLSEVTQSNWMDAILHYLDEEWELNQEALKKLQRDLK